MNANCWLEKGEEELCVIKKSRARACGHQMGEHTERRVEHSVCGDLGGGFILPAPIPFIPILVAESPPPSTL